MKILFTTLIALVVVFVGYTFIHSNTGVVSAPSREIPVHTIDTLPVTKSETVQEETVSQNQHSMPDGTIMGNDVNMEFPVINEAPPTAITPDTSKIKTFTVLGSNFVFDTKEIRVKKGDTVTIIFGSTDGFHDFVVDAFSAKTERIKTGGKTSTTFVADTIGTYEYYCSVGSHRMNGMVGKLIVE